VVPESENVGDTGGVRVTAAETVMLLVAAPENDMGGVGDTWAVAVPVGE